MEHEADAPQAQPCKEVVGDAVEVERVAQERDIAGRGAVNSADDVEQARFPAPGGAPNLLPPRSTSSTSRSAGGPLQPRPRTITNSPRRMG